MNLVNLECRIVVIFIKVAIDVFCSDGRGVTKFMERRLVNVMI